LRSSSGCRWGFAARLAQIGDLLENAFPAVLSWVAVGINALFFYAIKTEAKKKPNPYMGNELETKKIFSRPQRHNFYKSFLLH
jgi:hypothetical protein